MRSFCVILIIAHFFTFSYTTAQQAISGRVILMNSQSRTGEIEGVEQVHISAEGVKSTLSDSLGYFKINVAVPKKLFPLTIEKEGYVLVNRIDVESFDWESAGEMQIVLEEATSFGRGQQNIYESCETILSSNFKDKVGKIQVAINHKSKNESAFESMEKAIWDLEFQKKQVLDLLPPISKNINAINQDFAHPKLLSALEYFLKGYADKAVEVLDLVDLETPDGTTEYMKGEKLKILEALETQAVFALVQLDLEKAIEVFQNIIDHAEQLNISDEYKASIIGQLGLMYKIWGKSEAAESQFLTLEALMTGNALKNIELTIQGYQQLANYYYASGAFEKVLLMKQKILNYYENAPNIKPVELSEVYGAVAHSYFLGKDFESAIFYLNKAIQIQENELKKDHPLLAKSYLTFGRIYASINTQERSLNFFEKGLDIQKKALSTDHPDLIQTYISVGKIYESIGDHVNALLHYETALKIGEKHYLHQQPEMGLTYSSVASLYEKLGDYEKSLEYHKKALSLFEAVFDPENPALIISYKQIASVYEKIGDFQYALAFYENVVKLEEQTYGKTYHGLSGTYYHLAKLHHAVGNYNQANQFVEKSLKVNGGYPLPNAITGNNGSFLEKGGFATMKDSLIHDNTLELVEHYDLPAMQEEASSLDELKLQLQSGEFIEAETNALKYLGLDPQNDKFRVLLSMALASQGKLEKATRIWYLFKNKMLESGESFTENLIKEINTMKQSGGGNTQIEKFRSFIISK